MAANVIKIKRSTGTTAPAALANGELAFTEGDGTLWYGGADTPISIAGPITFSSYATTDYVDTADGKLLPLDGKTPMAGALDMGSNLIHFVTDPVDAQDAATKKYVDDGDAGVTSAFTTADSGITSAYQGADTQIRTDFAAADATTLSDAEAYADAGDAKLVPLAGGMMTGLLVLSADPAAGKGAATKDYVDNTITASTVTKQYVDDQDATLDAATLASANSYTDTAVTDMATTTYVDDQDATLDAATLASANSYTDTAVTDMATNASVTAGDAATLGSAKSYTDTAVTDMATTTYVDDQDATLDAATLASANSYTDTAVTDMATNASVTAGDAATLGSAKSYTDTAVTDMATNASVTAGDAATLGSAKSYTDTAVTDMATNASVTAGDAATLGSAKSYTDTAVTDMATTTYVDDQDALAVKKAGDTMTGALTLTLDPTANSMQAATTKYVDGADAALNDKITAMSGSMILVGTYDAPGDTVTPGANGLASAGPLPAAAPTNNGWYVIVQNGGDPTSSHLTADPLAVGDWLISDGNAWLDFAMSYDQVVAVNVGVTPVGSLTATDVQDALAELDSNITGGVLSAGKGIDISSNTVSVVHGTGIVVNGGVGIDPSWTGQAAITTVGTIGTGTWKGSIIDIAYLDVGTMASQDAGAVAITGGTIDGCTIDGGTF